MSNKNKKKAKVSKRTLRIRIVALVCAALMVGSCLAVVFSIFHF